MDYNGIVYKCQFPSFNSTTIVIHENIVALLEIHTERQVPRTSCVQFIVHWLKKMLQYVLNKNYKGSMNN